MNYTIVKPKKSLGQHFLRDGNILRKIVNSLELQEGEVLLEIGAGDGSLTRLLATFPITLIAVEIDKRIIQQLRDEFGNHVQIINKDIRSLNITELSASMRKKLRIVGNIPYYLTSDILFHIYQHHTAIADATLMMQREVAERLVASPNTKEYGILSVMTQFYCVPEILFSVSRNVFFPKPNVDSAVVHLVTKNDLPSIDEENLKKIVRATFGKRRKTLRNSLMYSGVEKEALLLLDFNLERRPESLTVTEFIQLTDQLAKQPLPRHD
ncbi:MAG TPA: 16S rRNA (adenine(1518)-N(6)/adenine(1519)-N(6))-dimethyltransferase RsmA [Bacteroidota bacterium]|nr:16S rRNA (adenine(1518)-N(6)/adenine(1519)-N(6))-dimethyltransferase RsmA [Bacteroidota bacterium]